VAGFCGEENEEVTVIEQYALYWPIATILCAIPVFCYHDLKSRQVPILNQIVLAAVNLPLFIYFYLTGIYTWEAAAVSVLPCIIYYILMRFGYIQGDDMLFLWIVSIFCVQNPIHPDQGGMAVTVMLYLIGVMVWALLANFIRNVYVGRKDSIIKMFRYVDRGFPLILPISAAFILAVIL
jgi:hypothetical protein